MIFEKSSPLKYQKDLQNSSSSVIPLPFASVCPCCDEVCSSHDPILVAHLIRMKGGISRFRDKEFCLLLIVLVCATILLWSWQRTPLLTTGVPTKDVLQLPEETQAIDKPAVEVENSGTKKISTRLAEVEAMNSYDVAEREEKDKHASEVEKIDFTEISRSTTEAENYGEHNLKEKEEILHLAAPIDSANTSSSLQRLDGKNLTTLVKNQSCSYAKGKWIVDDGQPLYSGFNCKQWLSPMWACRLMQREDFAYEKLRWQTKGCRIEEFEGSRFLKRMQGKTIAFVGDSLGRQQYQSLMCMITGGQKTSDVIDVGIEYGLAAPEGGDRPSGWAHRFTRTNTTVLYYWSACLCDLEPINVTNPVTDIAMHLDRPPAFLRQFLHKFDVLVLNTGHHWNRGKLNANRWVMYVGGKHNTDRKLIRIGDAKNFTIHSIVSWVNSQLPKHPHVKTFYRSISPRHFVNGDWNTGGSCNNTTPLSIGKEILQDESSDYSARNAVKGTGVKLLDITALSNLRDEGHISHYSLTSAKGVHDCLHWCLPGVPDTWNEILFAHVSVMSQAENERT